MKMLVEKGEQKLFKEICAQTKRGINMPLSSQIVHVKFFFRPESIAKFKNICLW